MNDLGETRYLAEERGRSILINSVSPAILLDTVEIQRFLGVLARLPTDEPSTLLSIRDLGDATDMALSVALDS